MARADARRRNFAAHILTSADTQRLPLYNGARRKVVISLACLEVQQ